MKLVYEFLNLVREFDLRDNPNGGTCSLVQATYLKTVLGSRVSITREDHISARRLSLRGSLSCV